jgi:hypothetical protein
MRSRVIRVVGPFAAAIGLALVVDVAASATSWSANWTFALAGFAAAVLLLFGTPFAFGFRLRLEPEVVEDVVVDEPAVRAEHRYRPPTPTESDLVLVFAERLDEADLVGDDPSGNPAGRAVQPRTFPMKVRANLIEVGH